MKNDILKKLVETGIAISGLEYVKHRFNGGRPLLEKAVNLFLQIRDLRNRIECVKPITIEADDCKIV